MKIRIMVVGTLLNDDHKTQHLLHLVLWLLLLVFGCTSQDVDIISPTRMELGPSQSLSSPSTGLRTLLSFLVTFLSFFLSFFF